MHNEQIKKIKKYLIHKYNGKLMLEINQVADEFLMTREDVKRLKHEGRLRSLSCGMVATYIVNNPPINHEGSPLG